MSYVNNLQGGLLSFNGNFWANTNNTGGRTFTLAGNGDTLINGSIIASAAAFDHSFIKQGTGTLTVTGTGTTLDGSFTIDGGTVNAARVVGTLLGTGTATGSLNLGSGGNSGTLNYTGAGETIVRNINLNGTTGGARINANQTSGTPLVLQSVTVANNTSKTLTLGGSSTLENEISTSLSNPGSGALSLAKTDRGTWVLSVNNTFTGNTNVSNGTLVLKATTPTFTNVLQDSSPIVFGSDAVQAAGGRLVYRGAGPGSVETIGVIQQLQGHSTVRSENGGTLVVSGLAASTGSTGASVNFEAPTASESISITGASGFVQANTYFNGANFAYADFGGALRAPVYGSDLGFSASATGPLAGWQHNEMVGSFATGGGQIASLKIAGSHTLSVTGTLGITLGAGSGGILVDGGNATITGTGAITQGLGAGPLGGALVIRVNQASDSLALNVPITNSTTQGLAKNGLGTLILGAANNQSGTTQINEGTVRLAPGGRLSAANAGLAIRQDAILDLNGVTQPLSTIGSLNGTGIVTNNGAASAAFAFGGNNQGGLFSGVIQDGISQLSVLKQSGGTVILTGLNTYSGPTTIASFGGLQITNIGNIGLPSGIGAGDATSDASNAASLVFTGNQAVSAATGLSLPSGLIYAGTTVGTTNRLFTLGGTGVGAGARLQASGVNNVPVIFTNTAPIAYTAAGNTTAQTLTLSGVSTGDNRIDLHLVNPSSNVLGVTKIDAGRWALGNATNSYTGPTRILNGVLEANHGTTLPANSPLQFSSHLGFGAGGVLETSGSFTRALDASGTAAGSVNFNANGNFPGSGGFASSGAKLTVNLGGTSVPLTWGAGGFLMNSNSAAATLRLSSFSALGETEFQNPINLGASTGARNIQVDDNLNTGADFATISGVISGSAPAGGTTKTGGGVLYLTGNNIYTGTTTVAGGTLVVRSLGSSSTPGATSVGDSTAGNTDAGAVLIGNGTLGSAVLQYVGPGETSDRKIRFNTTTGGVQIHADGAGPLILTNVANDVATGAKTLSLRGTNAASNRIIEGLTDAPSGGGTTSNALTVTVDGSAMWILSGNNTYTGATNASAGALGIGAGDSPIGVGPLVFNNGSIFADGADRTISNPVVISNNTTGAVFGDYSITVAGPLVTNAAVNNIGLNNNIAAGKAFTVQGLVADSITGNRQFTIDGPGETILNGNITSATAFGFSLTKTGTGLLRLNGAASNFTQNGASLDIDNGTVILGAMNAIPSAPGYGGVIFSPDNGQNETATLDLNGFSQTINSLTGTNSSASVVDNGSGVPVTLTIGANDGAVNANVSLTNSGGGMMSLVKAGSAAGNIFGPNISYGGTTTVQGGSLAFRTADPVATTGITVSGGAGLSLINGAGSPLNNLTVLNLGSGVGATSLGLDLGTTSDTLTVSPAAVTANTVNFSIGAAPGFGSSPSYTLLSAPAGGLGGATYALNGLVPGGYTYSLTPSNTTVILNLAATGPATKFWRGDVPGNGSSWSAYVSGNTNWEDFGGGDPASNPGPLDAVVFSSTINQPGSAYVTTLDSTVLIDSLQFNGSQGQAASSLSARVNIAAGNGGTLTIAPVFPTAGIEVSDQGGVASISAPVMLAADQTWSVGSIGSPRPELIISGPLSGAGNVTKIGAGTASLTGFSTRTGRTIIQEGTVRIQSEASLGANPSVLDPGSITLNGGSATLRSIAALTIDDTNRGITIGANGGIIDTAGGNITVGSTATPSLNRITGSATLRKEAGNILIINSNNSSTLSSLIVVNGGAVRAGVTGALGTGGVQLVNTGTILEVGDGASIANSILISAVGTDKAIRLAAGASAGTVSGAIIHSEEGAGNFRAQASGTGVLTIAGSITAVGVGAGTASPALRINEVAGNTGVVVLAGANSYVGSTEVRQGTLRNGANEVIPTSIVINATVNTSPSATYDLNGFNETVSGLTFGALSSSTAAYVNNVTTGTGTLTLAGNVTTLPGTASAAANLSGRIAVNAVRTFSVANALSQEVDLLVGAVVFGGAGTGVSKTGDGTMELSGNSAATYSGATSVSGGTLLVSGSISGSTVTISGSGVLGGTGAVGAITGLSGTVSPGRAGIGTLTATSLTVSGSTQLALEINSTTQATDLLSTTGPLSLSLSGTPLSISDFGSSVLPFGTALVFATHNGTYTGSFAISGNPISDDFEYFSVGVNQFALDYNFNGNSVALIAVPEPGVVASLLGGFGLLVGLQRLRRRSGRP